MVNANLPANIVIGGTLIPDQRQFSSSNLSNALSSHSTVVNRAVFYMQWAMKNAGTYSGPIDGKVGPTNDLFNAIHDAWGQGYAVPAYPEPVNNNVPFATAKVLLNDWQETDNTVYRYTS